MLQGDNVEAGNPDMEEILVKKIILLPSDITQDGLTYHYH